MSQPPVKNGLTAHLSVQSRELVEKLNYVAWYIHEARSVAARDIIRRGLESFVAEVGFATWDEFQSYVESQQEAQAS